MSTKRPGPRKRYGDREAIRLLLPVEMKQYIEEVSNNVTEWILEAIKEKQEREKTSH